MKKLKVQLQNSREIRDALRQVSVRFRLSGGNGLKPFLSTSRVEIGVVIILICSALLKKAL